MNAGDEIRVYRGGWCEHWLRAREGAVWYLFVHGTEWPSAIRSRPPRVRLLEDAKAQGATRCELVDPWPGGGPGVAASAEGGG